MSGRTRRSPDVPGLKAAKPLTHIEALELDYLHSGSNRPTSRWTIHGYIRVNERLETSAAEVWAIGECAGSPQFTHVSEDDFRIIKG